jgi:hypothetical protein
VTGPAEPAQQGVGLLHGRVEVGDGIADLSLRLRIAGDRAHVLQQCRQGLRRVGDALGGRQNVGLQLRVGGEPLQRGHRGVERDGGRVQLIEQQIDFARILGRGTVKRIGQCYHILARGREVALQTRTEREQLLR